MVHEVNRECDNRLSELEHWAFGIKKDDGIDKEFRDLAKRLDELERQITEKIIKWHFTTGLIRNSILIAWTCLIFYFQFIRK